MSRSTSIRLLVALAAAGAAGAVTAALAQDESPVTGSRAAAAHASAFARDDGRGHRRGYVSVSGDGARTGAGTAVSSSTRSGHGAASARARARRVSIFDGLVTADSVSVSASASGSSASKGGRVTNLAVNGDRKGTLTTRRKYRLGGYGRLVVLGGSGRGIVGLAATLTRDYHGTPAGTTVKVAYAAASARDAVAPPHRSGPAKPAHRKHHRTQPTPKPKPKPHHTAPARKRHHGAAKPRRRKPPRTHTLATSKGFVFPVHGKHEYTDTFGAPRADTGFHEGNDIFAPAGTPVVAVCNGSLNRVGTLPISGNRLWVKCTKGDDSFFYAHLSSFASDTRSGAHVTAGQVVGFVGSTGDAEQTPPHLHFEVHPGDGPAVDPYPFLRAWERHRDVPAAAWVRRNGASGQQPGTLVVVRDFLDR